MSWGNYAWLNGCPSREIAQRYESQEIQAHPEPELEAKLLECVDALAAADRGEAITDTEALRMFGAVFEPFKTRAHFEDPLSAALRWRQAARRSLSLGWTRPRAALDDARHRTRVSGWRSVESAADLSIHSKPRVPSLTRSRASGLTDFVTPFAKPARKFETECNGSHFLNVSAVRYCHRTR